MKSINYIIGIVLFTSLAYSCNSMEDTFALQKTVFIEDSENPGLPIYSEWGYNTFGAYIDRQPFSCDDNNLPTKIIINSDTMNILFKGKMNGEYTAIKFAIKGYAIADYKNLNVLNDRTINLKSDNNTVTLTRGNKTEKLKIIEGTFVVKRVQDLYVDKEYTKAIVSGIFSLKTFFENEPVAISNGRFDLGIGYENFYNY